jgi:hypothetical protein
MIDSPASLFRCSSLGGLTVSTRSADCSAMRGSTGHTIRSVSASFSTSVNYAVSLFFIISVTSCEFYMAYADYNDLMSTTEDMVSSECLFCFIAVL